MADEKFTCSICSSEFTLPAEVRQRYPRWKPSKCPACFNKGGSGGKSGSRKSRGSGRSGRGRQRREPARTQQVTPEGGSQPPVISRPLEGPEIQPVTSPQLQEALAEALASHTAGPGEGLFTDGACSGNPGPGGWGAVLVRGGEVRALRYGRSAHTTNNRMELRAIIAAYQMLGPDDTDTIWSDSNLCVNTINSWAAAWARRGWRRKGGAVKNLDLVKEVYQLSLTRPRAKLKWIKAHSGNRWNEYVDTLASEPLD